MVKHSHLRGNDDYVFNGNWQGKALLVGYLKDLGKQPIHPHRVPSEGVHLTTLQFVMKLVKDCLARLKVNAYSIGARYGKTVKFQNGTYIEPQAQLSYTHFGGDSFDAGRTHVNQSGVSSTAGGLGLEIGKTFGAGNIYTRVV